MDAAALKATLIRLTEALPSMNAQVAEAVASGEAAVSAGDELAQHAQQLAEQADEETAHAQQAVEELTAHLDQKRGEMADVHAQLEARTQELGELDAPLGTLAESVGHVEDGLARVQGALAGGAADLDTAAAATHEQLESLFGALGDGHQRLAAGAAEATTAFKAVEESAQTGHQALAEESDELVHQVTGSQDALVEKVGTFVSDADQSMGALSSDLTETLPKMLQDPVGQALDEVQSGIHDQIQQMVRSAMDDVLGSLDDFAAKVEDARKGSELSQAVLKPLFEEVENLAKPLIECLDSIKEAAAMVGIAF